MPKVMVFRRLLLLLLSVHAAVMLAGPSVLVHCVSRDGRHAIETAWETLRCCDEAYAPTDRACDCCAHHEDETFPDRAGEGDRELPCTCQHFAIGHDCVMPSSAGADVGRMALAFDAACFDGGFVPAFDATNRGMALGGARYGPMPSALLKQLASIFLRC